MSRENWAYIAYAATAVTVVVLLFTLVMIRRVAVAVACIKVGGGQRAACSVPPMLPQHAWYAAKTVTVCHVRGMLCEPPSIVPTCTC